MNPSVKWYDHFWESVSPSAGRRRSAPSPFSSGRKHIRFPYFEAPVANVTGHGLISGQTTMRSRLDSDEAGGVHPRLSERKGGIGMYAPLSLVGRVAVVLGGTSGIGRALALGLAAAGADVVPSGRRSAEVDSTATEIELAGRRSLRVPADVTSRKSLEHLLEEVLLGFDKVDILVNCAGQTKRTPTLDLTDEQWNAIL